MKGINVFKIERWKESKGYVRIPIEKGIVSRKSFKLFKFEFGKETPVVKKFAVLVRDRQSEALRMAVGLILLDDIVDVYVLDKKVEETEGNQLNIETLSNMGMTLYTNWGENQDMQRLSNGEIAHKLFEYDNILPY